MGAGLRFGQRLLKLGLQLGRHFSLLQNFSLFKKKLLKYDYYIKLGDEKTLPCLINQRSHWKEPPACPGAHPGGRCLLPSLGQCHCVPCSYSGFISWGEGSEMRICPISEPPLSKQPFPGARANGEQYRAHTVPVMAWWENAST